MNSKIRAIVIAKLQEELEVRKAHLSEIRDRGELNYTNGKIAGLELAIATLKNERPYRVTFTDQDGFQWAWVATASSENEATEKVHNIASDKDLHLNNLQCHPA